MLSLNDRLGLFEGNTEISSVLTIDLKASDYAPVVEAIRPKITIARWIAGSLLAAFMVLNGLSSIGLGIIMALGYVFCEWWFRSLRKTDFIFSQLVQVAPDSRQRDGDVVLCYDVSKIVISMSENKLVVVPAQLIESAKASHVGGKSSRYELRLKLHGRENWITMGSNVSTVIEDRIRAMNPALTKRKWWQF